MKTIIILLQSTLLLLVCFADKQPDPYAWMEEVEGEKAITWVKAHNHETLAKLKADEHFEERENAAFEILNAKDRILYATIRGDFAYNFWRDADHTQGLWRRTSLENYLNQNYDWKIVLDLDQLSADEEKHWVWKGSTFYSDTHKRCLIEISDGGTDAAEIREFDLDTLSFPKDGFLIPKAKSNIEWENENTLLVATDWGENSLNKSGYPRIIKRLKRGQNIDEAELVFEGAYEHAMFSPKAIRENGKQFLFIHDYETFFESVKYLLLPEGKLLKLPIPKGAEMTVLFEGQLVIRLRKEWDKDKQTFTAGSLVSFDLQRFIQTGSIHEIETLFTPTLESAVNEVKRTSSAILLNINHNVTSEVFLITREENKWTNKQIELPSNGRIQLTSVNAESSIAFMGYESFLNPDSLIQFDSRDSSWKICQKLPARFESSELVVEQAHAKSKDGTLIPYFVVHSKSMKWDGSNPTYLYGYGGFEVSMTPFYLSTYGKLWVEKGGVFVLSNIRGGGEFGPRWHQAALKSKRQNSYDDFHAIAEDLIKRKITSPAHLGIGGGSNGGLLVGVAFTQRPDLYHAVFCAVPLLDMLRYHELPPGASWMSEYGDPRIPEERAIIEKYSPYQNLKKDANYPAVFFYTSTKDDRVHPAHARKMAALMEEMGHPFYYFERIEGGHAGGANLKQYAELYALQFTYLFNQLGEKEKSYSIMNGKAHTCNPEYLPKM